MNLLEMIIPFMRQEEIADFKINLARHKSDSKELKYFEQICQVVGQAKTSEEDDDEAATDKSKSLAAMNTRITNKLCEFIAARRIESNDKLEIKPEALRDLAITMLERQAFKPALKALNVAERLAVQSHQYDLLHSIYNLQLTYFNQLNIDHGKLLEKRQKNKSNLEMMNNLSEAFAEITLAYATKRMEGQTLNPEETINSVFGRFNIKRNTLKNADYMLKLTMMSRTAIVSSKEYRTFAPYVIRVFEQLKRLDAFEGLYAEHELKFLHIITHTLYRNLRFDEARIWLKKSQELLPTRHKCRHPLFSKITLQDAAINSFTGNNAAAIAILEAAIEDTDCRIIEEDKLDMLLNLSVYYFQSSDFKKANYYINKIDSTSKWIIEHKGREWLFKKETIELIIIFELGHKDLAYDRVKGIQKRFATFLLEPAYHFPGIFLKLILIMIEEPGTITSIEFAEKVKAVSHDWPGERRDIQAITFFCWLKSKMTRQNYYTVLVGWMADEAQRGEASAANSEKV